MMAIAVIVISAVSVGLWQYRDEQAGRVPQVTEAIVAGCQPTAQSAAKPDFNRLKGTWLRPDGGYILEIKQVADDGKIDVEYLNPRKINISKALASLNAGTINLFVNSGQALPPAIITPSFMIPAKTNFQACITTSESARSSQFTL
jgi:hypothetical protein